MLVDYVRVYQGDWSAIPDTVAPDYTAAAEGVVALIGDVYESETDTVWKVDGSSVSTVGLTAEDDAAFPNLHFVGIEPSVPFDLTAVDTFHIRLNRTDFNADLEIARSTRLVIMTLSVP